MCSFTIKVEDNVFFYDKVEDNVASLEAVLEPEPEETA